MESLVQVGETGISTFIPEDIINFSHIPFPQHIPSVTYIENTINLCCIEGTCRNNFINISDSVISEKQYPIIYNYDHFCKKCGYPASPNELHHDLLKYYVEDLFNLKDLREYTDGPRKKPKSDVWALMKEFQKELTEQSTEGMCSISFYSCQK